MAPLICWMLIVAACCSSASSSVFKTEEKRDRNNIYEDLYEEESDDEGPPVEPADLVRNQEELQAAIHSFMVEFEKSNEFEPKNQMESIKKAINAMILVLITQSYVHVFKPDLERKNLASAVKKAGMDVLEHTTTDEQRAAYISELAAEVKTLPLSTVNDFILEYVSVDDDNELILKTLIKLRGDTGDSEVQRLKGEVLFSKVIQEMILQSYVADFNIEEQDGKIIVTSSDGVRSRMFNPPLKDTLTKIKLMELRKSYE